METLTLHLQELNTNVSVVIERKNIKTCRLKVFPDKTVKFSVSENTPTSWIETFLSEKTSWISTKLLNFEKTKGYAATTQIRDGYSIRYLGEDLIFSVSESSKPLVYLDGRILYVSVSDVNNQDEIFRHFEAWWRKNSLAFIDFQLERLYPIIQKYEIARPKIMLRKMKTLWGSCSPNRGVITFNQYLTKARPACVEYVVLHELIHFLYPNHSKQFYNFLSSYMPDWKERKRILDLDVVHGL